jgi:signal transduction histidine kinase
MRRALNDTALLLRNSADVHDGHEIAVDLPATELWYEADEGQIKQIVWNLATNGLRAMPGGGRLVLRATGPAERAEGDGGMVALEVQDEGIGIPAEQLDTLFQPFRGSFPRGSGLGLAIVHRIVSDHGGRIAVVDAPGGGARFAIELPLRNGTALLTSRI